MPQLKSLSAEGVPAALAEAERYRLRAPDPDEQLSLGIE